jgi:DNA-binding NarL/FixJ family response regulator
VTVDAGRIAALRKSGEGDGVAAIEKAKERAPALVILDRSMPRMNGVEAASVLRGMLPGTKIVGYTTFGEEFRRAILAATAFDMILSKHEGLAKLAETINALLPPPHTTD